MSVVRDKAKEKLYNIVEDKVMTKALHTGQQIDDLVKEVLSVPELAIVDREAESPSVVSINKMMRHGERLGMSSMLKAGYVKEVKNDGNKGRCDKKAGHVPIL